MTARLSLLGLMLLGSLSAVGPAQAACDRRQIAEIPVTMKGQRGLRPMVTAKINGVDAQMLFDTGADQSLLFPRAEAKFQVTPAVVGKDSYGRSNGRVYKASVAVAADFVFAGAAYRDTAFAVPESGFGPGIDGLLGQNHLQGADLEIDLAHGAIRMFEPSGCEASDLAYWRGAQSESVVEMEAGSAGAPRFFGTARVNGVPLRVMFDTGTPDTHMTYEAALRAGVDPAKDGATPVAGGVGIGGGPPMSSWVARFGRFRIGDEQVQDAQLRVVEKPNATADMLIGADFFLSHRVFISRSQHRLYFTDNPGDAFGVAPKP